jgi:hypothetical protein
MEFDFDGRFDKLVVVATPNDGGAPLTFTQVGYSERIYLRGLANDVVYDIAATPYTRTPSRTSTLRHRTRSATCNSPSLVAISTRLGRRPSPVQHRLAIGCSFKRRRAFTNTPSSAIAPDNLASQHTSLAVIARGEPVTDERWEPVDALRSPNSGDR